jgi:hypothetical protein
VRVGVDAAVGAASVGLTVRVGVDAAVGTASVGLAVRIGVDEAVRRASVGVAGRGVEVAEGVIDRLGDALAVAT